MPRRSLTVAVAALLALGAAACTNDDNFESVTTTTSAASAGTLPEAAVQTTAEELVREYYANLTCEGKDAEAYAALLDDSFVSVTATGVKDRAAVLKLLETNCFGNPAVSDIRAHQTSGVLVVPYVGKVDSNGVPIVKRRHHPQNPRHPTWWHVRSYALFAANPFGKRDFELDPKTKKAVLPEGAGNLTIEAGRSATFRWRFYFHQGDEKQAKVAERYREYAAGK